MLDRFVARLTSSRSKKSQSQMVMSQLMMMTLEEARLEGRSGQREEQPVVRNNHIHVPNSCLYNKLRR